MNLMVYHVFLLVFVTWVVRSHGRAYESESIIYNNTQLPYKENTNPESVDYSKLESFRSCVLALQWRSSYCSVNGCHQLPSLQIPNDFTVHGLWPYYDWRQPPNCVGSARFNERNWRSNGWMPRRTTLSTIWPNFDIRRDNVDFWEYEYDTHGYCFFPSPEEFFESAYRMRGKIPLLYGRRDGRGLYSRSYRLSKLRQVIFDVTKGRPVLRCVTVGASIYLLEIRFCFSGQEVLVNCSVNIVDAGCSPRSVYLPPR